MRGYRAFDPRHLYTQGSNNFQFTPLILEEEDFYCGVRFSKDRLFRGLFGPLNYDKLISQTEGRQLLYSLSQYVNSEEFQPEAKIELDELQQLLGKK